MKTKRKPEPYTTAWFEFHGYQDGVAGLAMAFPTNQQYMEAYKRGMAVKPLEF